MIQPADHKRIGLFLWVQVACLLSILLLIPKLSYASICATVKIEIQQELALERQAFDAHMRINNTLSSIPIEDVAVTVNFTDEAGNTVLASSDPNDTSAVFYIRIDTMDNIDDASGNGSVPPETSADIHWLIIPSPGASNGLESGTLYYVGATLTYTLSGQSETIEVSPDYIFVKPMPQLVLDYFLPEDVYGDDPHTSTIEPSIPFNVGLRVRNNGDGYARALKIDSAQPKIVENDLGLLIGFQIDGSTVNGQAATDSLNVDFGDIAPHSSGTARWIMSCSLSGKFIEFGAEFSHADDLGGELTSLIAEDDVNTHVLIHDVLVDASGRDDIKDFLALDTDVYRVYESDNSETIVTNQSAGASLVQQSGSSYTLSTPVTAGFMYAQLADVHDGTMVIKQVIRSDGKQIKPANAWLSKTRTGSSPWEHFVNIFDHNTTGSYTIIFESAALVPQAPVIAFIPERSRVEGVQLAFLVEASDPNGTIPTLKAESLPIGASFVDESDGTGVFSWTPTMGQSGRYAVRFIASDGNLNATRQAMITILSADDTDGDGMLDSWETDHFGNTDRDGAGDFDGDGISDLNEFLNGFDPTMADSAPTIPEIVYPRDGAHVGQRSPAFEILNSIDPEGDAFVYTIEVYADPAFNDLIASQTDLAPQSGTTNWAVTATLEDNAHYYWRVKAHDATGSSNWAYGEFFINTQPDPPTAPGVSYPADTTFVDTTMPALEATNSNDLDEDELTYNFEIFTDNTMTEIVVSAQGIPAGGDGTTTWDVSSPLEDDTQYYWRAIAVDGNGGETPGPLSYFRVDALNGAPGTPTIQAPEDGTETVFSTINLIAAEALDPDGDTLTYLFEVDVVSTFDSPAKLTSESITAEDGLAAWSLNDLQDDTLYHWRVKASDAGAHSRWASGTFFVNSVNNTPPTPLLKNPAIDAWVNTQTPKITVHAVSDSDADDMRYRFELYADQALTQPIGYAEEQDSVWLDTTLLPTGQRYYWRAQAVDAHGVAGDWSETGMFFVKLNSIDVAPQFSFIDPSEEITTNGQEFIIQWSDADPDSNAAISLFYDSDNSGADGILIADNLDEDPDGNADIYAWDISGLEGTYYLYATISDGTSSETIYASAAVIMDHTPPAISVDPPGGGYADALEVSLTANVAAQIYYTLDGAEPDVDSNSYSSPISITEDTTLKCKAVDTAGNWSDTVTHEYTFGAGETAVNLSTDKGRMLNGVRVYAFTESGAYTGKNATSDVNGSAMFNPDDFSSGNYKFRVDYLGHRFWSNIVALPDTRSIDVVIAEEPVTVTVDTAAGPSEGVRVYLYNASGGYLGQYLTTDANGQVTFDLPAGLGFTFRADLLGSRYWSDVTTVQGGSANAVPVNAGGGHFRVEVNRAENNPLTGIRVYLFSSTGSYLGHYATTDSSGQVGFDVPEGDYKTRVDYLGYQFWSADTAVTTDTQIEVAIPHQQLQVTVESRFQSANEPVENVKVYLFSAAGSYLGKIVTTDDQGRAFFDLPQKAYKVRADYMSQQFWSTDITWQDTVVGIPMADAQVTVTGGGSTLDNVRVYLFTAAGSYLGQNAPTDVGGQVLFRVPEGSYKFRADHQGAQFWSTEEDLAADQLHDIGISTGGGTFAFNLLSGPSQPLGNISCYVFDENDTYLGLQGSTDPAGQVTFDLANGVYKVRADYLGHQFWSDIFQLPDVLSTDVTISHSTVDVNVLSAGQAARNVRVYLFTDSGAYQGPYAETDMDGNVSFDLPVGAGFKFRADLNGRQYWSDTLSIPQTGPVPITIDTGGGRLELAVDDGLGSSMPDLKVYLFSDSAAYLGIHQTTDAAGLVGFDLSAGTYKLRVDYLGYHFWADDILVEQNTQRTLSLSHQEITTTVNGRFQGIDEAIAGVKGYLFTPTGTYLGQNQDTDDNGALSFNLPPKDYVVRVDYMGRQYWSDAFNQQNTIVTIPMADVQVTVTGAGLPQADISVYLFTDSGTYLGLTTKSDANGQVGFHLPSGSYKFRSDYQGNQYWSGIEQLAADQANEVIVSVGGGTFSLNVVQDPTTPIVGVKGYVFNQSDAYIGLAGATDDQGRLFFDLADGTLKFRVDYLGYQYWSQPVTIPAALSTQVDIPHQQITLTLSGHYLGGSEPLGDVKLYLFSATESYMGINKTTDGSGQALFSLPDREYKIRADILGNQYWSPLFRSQDTTLEIPQGAVDINVHRSGTDTENARVYLFNAAGSYLGQYKVTDAAGWVGFILPEGSYRFRADADGIQRWSEDVTITADQAGSVAVDLN